jgi:haloalkane dehalogenase
LLESLDLEEITLVVVDWGGLIGLSYATQHPERIRNIINTNTWLWQVDNDLNYQGFSGFVGGPVGRWLIREFNFFVRMVNKFVYGDKSKYTPAIQRHLSMHLQELAKRKGNWVFPKQIVAASDWLAELWKNRSELDGKVKFFAWGRKDIAFREKELNYWTRHFPDVRVVRYQGVGHFLAEEVPQELIKKISVILEK